MSDKSKDIKAVELNVNDKVRKFIKKDVYGDNCGRCLVEPVEDRNTSEKIRILTIEEWKTENIVYNKMQG